MFICFMSRYSISYKNWQTKRVALTFLVHLKFKIACGGMFKLKPTLTDIANFNPQGILWINYCFTKQWLFKIVFIVWHGLNQMELSSLTFDQTYPPPTKLCILLQKMKIEECILVTSEALFLVLNSFVQSKNMWCCASGFWTCYCHIVASTDGKYQIHLAERKIHCCPKYQILSAFELVSRKLFIVTLLLPLVAASQIGE